MMNRYFWGVSEARNAPENAPPDLVFLRGGP
ncbi:hypothetical protein C8N31_1331, partial [Sulfitobacter mediterraneus]